MKRKFTSYSVGDMTGIKAGMLNCAKQFNIFCLLDNHQYDFSSPSFESMLGAGVVDSISLSSGNALDGLKRFREKHRDWMFGHFAYDLKNEIEALTSKLPDDIGFPDLFFFVPQLVVIFGRNELKIGVIDMEADEVFDTINRSGGVQPRPVYPHPVIKSRFSKEDYIEAVTKLQAHILHGDCYEVNFCQEFFAYDAEIDPIAIFNKLAGVSPNPFGALYRLDDKYCICESPERFLKKTGEIIISQPIKGTVARDLHDISIDEENRNKLNTSKERSENVMIVDLVRNDLSRVCKEGSIKVDELFGIYQFPGVYQMISTISGQIDIGISIDQIIKATFPMGSMTGAPKERVMKLIEHYERSGRGLFSGSIGYLTPSDDFDFNVVIRSILYNASNKYLSIHAGSAITFYSDSEKEYEECLVKISAIMKVLI